MDRDIRQGGLWPAGQSMTVLRVRGIPVRLHWSLPVVIVYLAWVLSLRFGALAQKAGPGVLPPLGWGLILSTTLFAGVALHELGHSLVALAFRARVKAITLTFLGGVSEIDEMPASGRREALVALAGPLVSFALAAVTWALRAGLPGLRADVSLALSLATRLNLILAVFNLLPAFPLDGGRILRALLDERLGRLGATRAAASVSKAFAVAFGLLGLLGNWLLLAVALFLWVTADAELRGERMRAALRGLHLGDLVDPLPGGPALAPDESVAEAAARMVRDQSTVLAVAGPSDRPLAIVRMADLRAVAPRARASTPVGRVARTLPSIERGAPVEQVVRLLERNGSPGALVLDGSAVVGYVSPERISRALELADLAAEAGGTGSTPSRERPINSPT